MPTYDYSCDACEHTFEVFESIMAEPQKKCPKCKKSKLRRLFGAGAGLVFKGSGFYQTDYRSEGYKKAAAADKPASDKSSSEKSSSDKPDSSSKSSTSEAKSAPAKSESSGSSKKQKSSE
jgi:putative FmdB family regulatory protein